MRARAGWGGAMAVDSCPQACPAERVRGPQSIFLQPVSGEMKEDLGVEEAALRDLFAVRILLLPLVSHPLPTFPL